MEFIPSTFASVPTINVTLSKPGAWRGIRIYIILENFYNIFWDFGDSFQGEGVSYFGNASDHSGIA